MEDIKIVFIHCFNNSNKLNHLQLETYFRRALTETNAQECFKKIDSLFCFTLSSTKKKCNYFVQVLLFQ